VRATPHAFVNPPIQRQSFRAIDSDMIPERILIALCQETKSPQVIDFAGLFWLRG